MSRSLRIGFVGSQGHVKLAFEGLREAEGFSIDAVCPGATDDSVEGLQRESARLGQHPRVLSDWRELLAEALDIVVVAGPFEEHAAMTVAALQHGSHVLCEKPVACTWEDEAALRDALAAHPDCLVVPMLGMRYEPAFHTAHRLVANGAVGEVRLVGAQKSYRLGRRGPRFLRRATSAGIIPWVGIHAIDWVHWFSGQAFLSVDARHTTRANRDHGELEACAVAQFELAQDVFASVTMDYLRPATAPTHGDDRLRVVGTRGVVEVRDGQCYVIDETASGERRCELEKPDGTLFGDFLLAVRGQRPAPITHAELLAVNQACLLARDSADRLERLRFPSSAEL